MAKQTRTTLKTYFNTGDAPTESQFGDLIDSLQSRDEDTKGVKVICPSGGEGDYICDGVEDNVTFSSAIADGGTIFVKAGTYYFDNSVYLPDDTTIIGDGIGKTIIKIEPTSVSNFGYRYMFQRSGSATNCRITDMTVDGNYSNMSSPSTNKGGGIAVGDDWRIERVEFLDSNYFCLWVNGVDGVLIRDCQFNDTTGRNNDNIGGGTVTNTIIENNVFAENIHGNIIDFVCGSNITIRNNINNGSTTIYMEGVTDSILTMNVMHNTSIVLESNRGYSPSHVINPLRMEVSNNRINGGGYIALKYGNEVGSGTMDKGGYNKIINNIIKDAGKSGIIVYPSGDNDETTLGNDIISGNTVINSNQDDVSSWNTGNGICHPSGINVYRGTGYIISNNVCIDNQTTKTAHYGIEIGETYAQTSDNQAKDVIITGNIVQGKTDGINIVNATYSTNIIQENNIDKT